MVCPEVGAGYVIAVNLNEHVVYQFVKPHGDRVGSRVGTFQPDVSQQVTGVGCIQVKEIRLSGVHGINIYGNIRLLMQDTGSAFNRVQFVKVSDIECLNFLRGNEKVDCYPTIWPIVTLELLPS